MLNVRAAVTIILFSSCALRESAGYKRVRCHKWRKKCRRTRRRGRREKQLRTHNRPIERDEHRKGEKTVEQGERDEWQCVCAIRWSYLNESAYMTVLMI
jgi:hypothetical protein